MSTYTEKQLQWIDEKIATEVMKWHKDEIPYEAAYHGQVRPCWIDAQNKVAYLVEFWHPSRNLQQAFMALETIGEFELWRYVDMEGKYWYWWQDRHNAGGVDQHPALAACLMLLNKIDLEVPEFDSK